MMSDLDGATDVPKVHPCVDDFTDARDSSVLPMLQR
jgi:hypothetical protein